MAERKDAEQPPSPQPLAFLASEDPWPSLRPQDRQLTSQQGEDPCGWASVLLAMQSSLVWVTREGWEVAVQPLREVFQQRGAAGIRMRFFQGFLT